MEVRIEHKWALEELATALEQLKSVGLSVSLPNGEMYISGLGDGSAVYLDSLTPEAVAKAVKRAEDDQPIPDGADDC